jgi:hypothetical protein
MYSTKLLNKSMMEGNAYITVGDPFRDPVANPFRQGKKGEKEPTPFRTKVRFMYLRSTLSTANSLRYVYSSDVASKC